MRKVGEDPLIFDAGDMFFSKTSINSNNIDSEKFRCETMLEGYEKIGCSALNIGKYEVLAGLSFLKKMENKYSSIHFISGNIKDRKSGKLLFKPYITLNRDGLILGVIGLSNMIPDTMTSVITEDYISSGNNLIKEIKDKVDLIILLVNTDRSSQSSLAKNFEEADFIFTSGSTHRTSASMPQKPEGPFVYSNGKQGKYLTILDLDIKNSIDPITDVSAHEQKIKQLNNRLKRLQKKDPARPLDDIYAGQDNILSLIKRYRNDLSNTETILQKAKNKMKFTSFALNKKIKDDPEMLAMVNNALDKCSKLDKSKKLDKKHSHHNHNHSKKFGKKNN